jgi:hypothetical protein
MSPRAAFAVHLILRSSRAGFMPALSHLLPSKFALSNQIVAYYNRLVDRVNKSAAKDIDASGASNDP